MHKSKFITNFAAQNQSFAVFSSRRGDMSFGWVLIQDIKAFVSAPRSDLLMGSPKKHGDVSHGESGDNCRTCDLAIGGIANCELFGERDKRRLTRFVLALQNLVNSQIPKHCDTRCPLVCK